MFVRLGRAWESVSLRSKLTSLSVAIIGILILVSSYGTLTMMRNYLQQNTDGQLVATAQTLMHESPAYLDDRLSTQQVQLPRLPNDYYIAYLDNSTNLVLGLVSSTRSTQDTPDLRAFTPAFVLSKHGQAFEMTSKTATGSTRSWRVIAAPLDHGAGVLIVAIPTTSDDDILDRYLRIGAGFGTLLLIFSGMAIWYTISQALTPLGEVERTAAAVAAGDTSRRLLERPGKTEMARLNRSLNSMLDSIDGALRGRNQTLKQMRQFVADASHELRTPLVTIRGYAELYRMGALKKPTDVSEAMERIESEAMRMTDLVESLLTLARLDESKALEAQPVALVELARVAAKDASVADGSRQINLVSLDGKALGKSTEFMVSGDQAQLRQVLTNLLANACRFSPDKAAVEVALGLMDDKTVLEVRDHGEGIPEQLRSKVFERFFRADNSRNRETGGSGLGLSIVETIVKRHGGEIVALETPGGGATFRVTLATA